MILTSSIFFGKLIAGCSWNVGREEQKELLCRFNGSQLAKMKKSIPDMYLPRNL